MLMTLVIAYLSLVFGELVPKRLALQRAEGFSMAVAPTLDRFATLMRPVIWLLSKSTDAVVRLLGGDPNARSESMSTEELRGLVEEHDAIDAQGRRIARSALDAGDRILRESMRPWYDVSTIDARTSVAEATDHAIEVGHTRYLVTDGSRDHVDGFVHLRDLLRPADPAARWGRWSVRCWRCRRRSRCRVRSRTCAPRDTRSPWSSTSTAAARGW